MKEKSEFIEIEGLHVTVDEVEYLPDVSAPSETPHCFVYFISIHNDGDVPVTVKGRKWVVTDSRNEITVVEGDGVVGQFPTIQPGEKFSYNSYHLLATRSAQAEGAYYGLDAKGRKFRVRIPAFRMVVTHLA